MTEPHRFETTDGRPVPAVAAEGMREVDRVAVEETGPELLQMMENAGRTLADHAVELARTAARADGTGDDGGADGTDGGPADRPVAVLAGGGGNGGGGLCAARHLHDHGVDVRVLLDRPPGELTGAAATQHRVLSATPVPVHGPGDWRPDGEDAATDDGGDAGTGSGPATDPLAAVDLDPAEAVAVDALVGYGLTDPLRGPAAELVGAAGDAAAVLSLDVPTGTVATTGTAPGPAVSPDRTLTLALPKTGLVAVGGDLFLADLGIPPAVFERAGVDYPDPGPFDGEWSVRLRRA